MEYRKLPHGTEMLSTIGLGLGAFRTESEAEIEAIIRRALDGGINFFDLGAGIGRVFAPFGRAIAGMREKVYFQLHFGAVYDGGEYGWSRDMAQILANIDRELAAIGTDTIDFGMLHCIDEEEDLDALEEMGLIEHVESLKARGIVRHIGFSSHTPSVAMRLLDMGIADIMLFSINPAYDFEFPDEYAIGTFSERAELFRRCEREGVGISVMKPYHAGKLLDAARSPFGIALTEAQCLRYALDRPGVITTVPGIRTMRELEALLAFDAADQDYSAIASLTPEAVAGTCVYCGHCRPCPAGIDVGLVNKYYDLARQGDTLAASHYTKLTVRADACIGCGHCDARCPFGVLQSARMREIAGYFG